MGNRSFGRYRLLLCVLGVSLGLAPRSAWAHEKWFVSTWAQYPLQLSLLVHPVTIAAIIIGLALIGVLLGIRRLTGGDNLFPRISFLRRFDPAAPVVIAIQTAISIIWMAVNLRYFAPNLLLPNNLFGYFLAAAQLAVAFSFISGMFARWGAGLLILLVLLLGVVFGPVAMLEQTIFIGIAVYVALMGRGLIDPERPNDNFNPLNRYRPLAPTILRICTALSIVVLAFTEKLLNPELGVAFLREYPNFNVMQALGVTWFTDRYFVLAAGIAELAIGLTLLSGVLPRFVIFGMFVPFNLTIPFLPATELLGHLPIFAVMYVLLFHQPQLRADVTDDTLPRPSTTQPQFADQSMSR